jgi:hypothetical protein
VLAPATPLLIAAAIAGCGPFGGDDDDGADGAAGGSLSEQEFVQQGDEICRAAQQQVAEIQRNPPTSRQESARFAASLIEVFEDEVSQLEGLEPPAGRQDAYDRYLDARREAIDLLEQGRRAAEENDPQGYADAQAEVAAGQVKRAELARESGLRECSAPLAGGTAGQAP